MQVDRVRSTLRERISRRVPTRPRPDRPRQVDGVRSALAGLRAPRGRAAANSGNNG